MQYLSLSNIYIYIYDIHTHIFTYTHTHIMLTSLGAAPSVPPGPSGEGDQQEPAGGAIYYIVFRLLTLGAI